MIAFNDNTRVTSRNVRSVARQLADLEIKFVDSDEFKKRNAASKILTDPPTGHPVRDQDRSDDEIGYYLGITSELPLLTAEQEFFYFRRMNFLKRRAARAIARVKPDRPSVPVVRAIVQDLEAADADRDFIIRHNLRLVIPLAHRCTTSRETIWDYISEGNEALMRAVNGFDYSRGFRFSTYATWAVRRSLHRLVGKKHRDHKRFVATDSTQFNYMENDLDPEFEQLRRFDEAKDATQRLLGELDARSREVLKLRYGLGRRKTPATLQEIGEQFGVSKERIRQIEIAALGKLTRIAQAEQLDA